MKKFGPGLLVAAAFIGPGTIATASQAGANFGFTLLWALVFSIFATWVLQEMAARLGLVTGYGLTEALKRHIRSVWLSRAAILLVLGAIGFGNAAYEAGNIAGASLGISSIVQIEQSVLAIAIGLLAAMLLWINKYRLLEGVLIALVVLMSLVFLLTFLLVSPNWGAMANALLQPTLPDGGLLVAIALIGTTVVPYNLFLHASSSAKQWAGAANKDEALRLSRWDTGLSISLGGLISIAIMGTAATAFFSTDLVYSALTMAHQLEPLLGASAKLFFALGLFAAGLTSAIAAPMAAAFAVSGAFSLTVLGQARLYRAVALAIVAVGTLFSALGTKPLVAIVFAQVFNGFLLPVVAIFLLYIMNQKKILGAYVNGPWANACGALVVLTVLGLGAWKIFGVL
ncbi:Nramp family divalent metal transporter [Simiduia curdlanivorans]|uniref:Nramp family divalent metal transporter n=1 Tax=Simiduia curdlanivorans TaxID=1492769 RepID=A0ABV8V7B5_9GAMM|nr:Nramp family divalent metal transporter [Simiduia curdlanivorans]MDN3640679.1 Nramp family divalent metal transporter [Simiduia curdlanivorans]